MHAFDALCEDGLPVELVCSKENEATIYRCMAPPPSLECESVHCSVMMALGGQSEGIHGKLLTYGAAVQGRIQGSRLER